MPVLGVLAGLVSGRVANIVGEVLLPLVSALHVQVLGTDASALDLWAASSSVGPATVG